MQYLFSLIFIFFSLTSFASQYKVGEASKTKWHLHIESDTDVYGEIPVRGSLKEEKNTYSGELIFELSKTESYELEKDGEKATSKSRDSRIYSITKAKKHLPKFVVKSVEAQKGKEVKVLGTLSLAGVDKEIEVKGSLSKEKDSLHFLGVYDLEWAAFKIADPVVWFMKMAKTADPIIHLKFDIQFNKEK